MRDTGKRLLLSGLWWRLWADLGGVQKGMAELVGCNSSRDLLPLPTGDWPGLELKGMEFTRGVCQLWDNWGCDILRKAKFTQGVI